MQQMKTMSLAVAVLAAAACGNENAKSQKLTDPQIAGVLGSLDQSEVTVAQGALPVLQADAARRFAQMMIDQHSASKQEVSQVLSQQGLSPESSPLSQAIDRNAGALVSQLTDPEAAQVDLGYANSQVSAHQQALTLIDCVILADASNATLKSTVSDKVRPMVATHLGDANALVTELNSPATPDGGTDGGSVLSQLGQGATGDTADCSNLCTRSTEGGPLPEEYRLAACK
ncbi:MAG: DUF4142 domain-containing protein [Myxococcaceae bacterium]